MNLVGQNHIYLHQHQTNRRHRHLRQRCFQYRLHRYLAIHYHPLGMHLQHQKLRHHRCRLLMHHMFRHHQNQQGNWFHPVGLCHIRILCNLTSCRCHHRSLLRVAGLMLMFLTESQAYHHHLYPLMLNGHLGSRQHCCLQHHHHGRHLVSHKSCHRQNQQEHWMHHLGQSHRILLDHLPIHPGLYQIVEHHKFHRCHHRLEQRIGPLSQSYT